ncbi:hypothetical protein BOW52_10970 [Solemya elarraichensis gill symbiont]|uniref:Uncharacterized protein n=2 Tax=Solemya elarraichensis gill symbiont TaxID=1918949 RepID=A0A1T2KTC8_9GAMM|nr:hypothetical protein BOW52_10970 [Solemya elarraichensis gill symbiont]
MNTPEDFSKRCDDFAIYLPAIQKHYAKAAVSKGDSSRLPSNITMRDLNFLNPANKLWHYKYALYSAGQFNIGEYDTDIVTDRNKDRTLMLGDSGGFQIGKGTLGGFNNLRNRDPDSISKVWTDAVELKHWIVNWLETHSDYAMTIDMPLWAKYKENKSSPFHNCSTQQLIDLTVQNLRFINNNKRGNTKWLNVIQGTTYEDTKLWWNAVKEFRFNGWSLAGNAGFRGGAAAIIKQILIMRDEDAFTSGMDWLHILGVSQLKWAVLLTAIQRGLREHCNQNIRVSYDSASPTVISGKYEKIALKPDLTNKDNSWSIRVIDTPTAKEYTSEARL